MTDKSSDLRQLLFDAETISPALRASYDETLDEMLHPKMNRGSALVGSAMMLGLLAASAAILRNMFVYQPGVLTLLAWGILAVAFLCICYLIARDFWRKKQSRKSQMSAAQILTLAAGSITVVSLLLGLNQPSDPASTFNAFYVFVFYFACALWSLDSRIGVAELAAREQMLRIECRLADIAERLQKHT